MKKEKIKNLLLIVIVALVTSFVTAYGVSSTFDSSNVCYKVDSNTGASVQDTIDDLYGKASDYSELNNKVSTLEGYFNDNEKSLGGQTRGIDLTATTSPWIHMLYNNTMVGDFWANTNSGLNISSSSYPLNLTGNPVKINDKELFKQKIILDSTINATSGGTGGTSSLSDNIYNYNYLIINYYIGGWSTNIVVPNALINTTDYFTIYLYHSSSFYSSIEIKFNTNSEIKYTVLTVSSSWSSSTKKIRIIGMI